MQALSQDQVVKVLKTARAVIANKANWCTGSFARRADGSYTRVDSFEAQRFCARGAIMKALLDLRLSDSIADEYNHPLENQVSAVVAKQVTESRATTDFNLAAWLAHWNNQATHERVVAGFDKTIQVLENAA